MLCDLLLPLSRAKGIWMLWFVSLRSVRFLLFLSARNALHTWYGLRAGSMTPTCPQAPLSALSQLFDLEMLAHPRSPSWVPVSFSCLWWPHPVQSLSPSCLGFQISSSSAKLFQNKRPMLPSPHLVSTCCSERLRLEGPASGHWTKIENLPGFPSLLPHPVHPTCHFLSRIYSF